MARTASGERMRRPLGPTPPLRIIWAKTARSSAEANSPAWPATPPRARDRGSWTTPRSIRPPRFRLGRRDPVRSGPWRRRVGLVRSDGSRRRFIPSSVEDLAPGRTGRAIARRPARPACPGSGTRRRSSGTARRAARRGRARRVASRPFPGPRRSPRSGYRGSAPRDGGGAGRS